MYKVEPFIWYDLDEGKAIFQTRNSTVVVTNKNIRDFLVALEERKILNVDEIILNQYLGKMDHEKIVNFLVEQKILRIEEERKVCIKRTLILSNDIKFNKSIDLNLSDTNDLLFVDKGKLQEIEVKKTDLLLVFLNPFELKEMEKLVEIVKNKDIICKFVFSYNNKVYISNFYKKSWYNPCPLCFFYEIESQLRGEQGENTINFQTIIDLLYAENILFKSVLPLNQVDYLQIVYILSKYICFTPENYKLDEVVELNLSDYNIRKDIAYHWGYCDCYE